MGKLRGFFRSLSGPAFWLLVTALTTLSILLLLAAFSIVKLPQLNLW